MADRLLPRPKDAFATATRVVKLKCSTHASLVPRLSKLVGAKAEREPACACPVTHAHTKNGVSGNDHIRPLTYVYHHTSLYTHHHGRC